MTASLERTTLGSAPKPAAAWAVVDGADTHTGGLAGAGPDTRFSIGSLTKTFTAIAILQLADDGRIVLDDPVLGHPGVSAPPGVTVRELLTHTGGVRDHRDDLDSADFAYANRNYEILGDLITAISGRPYGDYLRERIFAPLGMTNSSVAPVADADAEAGHYLAFGIPVPGRDASEPSTPPGATGVVSTAGDLARLLRMLAAGGAAENGARVLSQQTARTMLEAQAPTPSNAVAPDTASYGFGAGISDNGRRAGHVGRVGGTYSQFVVEPSSTRGVVILQAANSWFYDQQAPAATAMAALDAGSPGDADPAGYGRSGGMTAAVLALICVAALVVFIVWSAFRRHRDRRGIPLWRTLVRFVIDLACAAALVIGWFVLAGRALAGTTLTTHLAPVASLEISALVLVLAVLFVGRGLLSIIRYSTAPRPV